MHDSDLPEGWFDPNDIIAYRAAVANVTGGGSVVEVGTWKGRSLLSIAPMCRARGIKLSCVDSWNSEPAAEGSYQQFIGNLKTWGMTDYVSVIRLASVAGAELFANKSLDLVFLDDDHRYEGCIASIRAWQQKVKPGGMLMGHDYNTTHRGVDEAVHEVFGSHKSHCVGGNCWGVRITEDGKAL